MNMWKNITNFVSTHTERIVVILAVILSVASFAYYYHAGLITAYGDSRGHLDIARRVVDSLTPGAAQLGGYWLPLLHVLMLPTIWNDFMWQSGLSGSIPNMIAFVVAVLFMYRLAFLVTESRFSAFIGASVLLFNPNLLYMQATPMTESLFVCTITVFMFYFYRWFREEKTSDLVLAAIFLVLSSLNRYEGWGLVIAANALMLWRLVERRFDKKTEGAVIAFGMLSFFGIFLWLLWGAVIFHDPLEFMHTASNIGNQAGLNIDWIGFHNLSDAFLVNAYATYHIIGAPLFLAILSLIVLVSFKLCFPKEKSVPMNTSLILTLLFVPFLFDFLTVYLGKVPIRVSEMSNDVSSVYFNVRYALFSLPVVAFSLSLFISVAKEKIDRNYENKFMFSLTFLFLIFVLASFSPFIFFGNKNAPVVLSDIGIIDSSLDGVERFLVKNFDNQPILISNVAYDSLMFDLGFSQSLFISEGSYRYWNESLKEPSRYATWVLISSKENPKDSLLKEINKNRLFQEFDILYKDDLVILLKKKFE